MNYMALFTSQLLFNKHPFHHMISFYIENHLFSNLQYSQIIFISLTTFGGNGPSLSIFS
mgnify:CR=1 FL=1